ncbi:MAG: hypothetical protein QOF98_2137 [Streptomyces sp.]|jgi:hypothetical protein|nr:hypothetical protein [Streptomyces sp.]
MTLLLDIATLSLLLLALSFVPAMGLRHEAKITREIRAAQQGRTDKDQRSAATQHVGLR